jgi:hypothetical protein
MVISRRFISLLALSVFLSFGVFSCAEKEEKKASFEFSETEFNVRQSHEQSYVLDARGKIRNASPHDVKNLVVTAHCRSCVLNFTARAWFISGTEKTANQVAKIGYLAAGAAVDFNFEEVAFYFTHEKSKPDYIPDNIEIVVESYEIVER